MLSAKMEFQEPAINTGNHSSTARGMLSPRSRSASRDKRQTHAPSSTRKGAAPSSQPTVPQSPKKQISKLGSRCDGDDDTGLASVSSTQNSINGGPVPPECTGIPVKGSNLKAFNKTIPDHIKLRFYDLKRLYSGPLLEAVQRRHLLEGLPIKKKTKDINVGDIGMKLKYMGHSESTAELYIVVQCDKTVSRKVKDFFAQEHVARDLGTDFRFHVVEEALTRFAASNDIRAFGNFRLRNTLCGVKVQLSLAGVSRTATIGGLIMVTTTKETLFGITAGHPLSELREQIEGPLTPPDGGGSNDGLGDHESERLPENGGEVTLHGDSADKDGLRVDLGTVTHDSFLSGRMTCGNHDWALIELKPENWLPNRLDPSSNSQAAGRTRAQCERQDDVVDLFCPEQKSNFSVQPAVAITSRGIQRGVLTQNESSVLMYPGKAFVETLEFTLDSNSALGVGDSGCWVVNELTGEVYGHTVSMDAFGEAYVMPIQGVLSDIQVHLQAEKVNLPASEGIALLQSLNTQSVTKNDQPMPSRSDLPRQAEIQDTVSYPETQQKNERTPALLENSNQDARVVSDGDIVEHRLSDGSELLLRELSQEKIKHAHTRADLDQQIGRISETLWETRKTVRNLEYELLNEREMKEDLRRQLLNEREMKEDLERQLWKEREMRKGLERELLEETERRKDLETAEKRETSEETKEKARKRSHEGSTIHNNNGMTVFNATQGEIGGFGIGAIPRRTPKSF